jgi:hypothetical protein
MIAGMGATALSRLGGQGDKKKDALGQSNYLATIKKEGDDPDMT